MAEAERLNVVSCKLDKIQMSNDVVIRRTVPNIRSDKFEANRKFYKDFLGFKIGMDMGWIISFVSPSNPTAQVSILQRDPSGIHPNISVEVGNVDEVYEKAKALGLEIVHPLTNEPWGVRRFFVRDPNGLVVNILTHQKPS